MTTTITKITRKNNNIHATNTKIISTITIIIIIIIIIITMTRI